jgi:HSP20 family molecular chaperone IbpA
MNTELSKRQETRPERAQQERWLKPACDVYESEAEWLVTADLPGVMQDALALDLDKTDLTIEARRGTWTGEGYAGYRRVFTLPQEVDRDKVSADLRHGVVSIHLPKSEAVKARRIAVTAG